MFNIKIPHSAISGTLNKYGFFGRVEGERPFYIITSQSSTAPCGDEPKQNKEQRQISHQDRCTDHFYYVLRSKTLKRVSASLSP